MWESTDWVTFELSERSEVDKKDILTLVWHTNGTGQGVPIRAKIKTAYAMEVISRCAGCARNSWAKLVPYNIEC